jgi:hypothetical protein
MTKEEQIMNFLHMNVFNPILISSKASRELKKGVQQTINRMRIKDARGMVKFYWSAVVGTDRSTKFARQMKKEGFTRFEEIIDEFREKFNDQWLRK